MQRPAGLLGWGINFAEGFDWSEFRDFGFIILILSIDFGICWSTLKHDISGGFGFTACMMMELTFTTGIVWVAVEPT